MSDSGSLKARVASELKDAMKAGDKIRLSTLRLLTAAVKNREVELLHELSDDELREVALKEVKRRNEAMEAFEAAGRDELVAKERAEREVLLPYIPEQLSDETVDALVEEAIAATGATTPQELGRVMGVVMAKAKGKADGAVIQAKVRARLGG